MTRLLTHNHTEFIADFLNKKIKEQQARGEEVDPMELRAHAMNQFRSHYTHDGRGNWNKELEAEVGSQIDDLLESKRQKGEI